MFKDLGIFENLKIPKKVQVFEDLVYFRKTFTKTSKCLINWTEKDSKDRATVFERKEVEGE